jgi:hypothetical protein
METNMIPMLAVTGEGMIKDLLYVFAIVVCGLIVWLLGRWIFPKLKAPPGVLVGWDVLFVVLGALIAINFILGLFGHPLIPWR